MCFVFAHLLNLATHANTHTHAYIHARFLFVCVLYYLLLLSKEARLPVCTLLQLLLPLFHHLLALAAQSTSPLSRSLTLSLHYKSSNSAVGGCHVITYYGFILLLLWLCIDTHRQTSMCVCWCGMQYLHLHGNNATYWVMQLGSRAHMFVRVCMCLPLCLRLCVCVCGTRPFM